MKRWPASSSRRWPPCETIAGTFPARGLRPDDSRARAGPIAISRPYTGRPDVETAPGRHGRFPPGSRRPRCVPAKSRRPAPSRRVPWISAHSSSRTGPALIRWPREKRFIRPSNAQENCKVVRSSGFSRLCPPTFRLKAGLRTTHSRLCGSPGATPRAPTGEMLRLARTPRAIPILPILPCPRHCRRVQSGGLLGIFVEYPGQGWTRQEHGSRRCSPGDFSPFEQLRFARQVILTESRCWPGWPTGSMASSAGRSN